MPAGRPSDYKPEFCDLVIEAGKEGKTKAEMAALCDVDRATINNWMDEHPEFFRAVKRGLDHAQAWWEDKGRTATFGGVDGFNATSYIFQMKNRFAEDWRDKQDVSMDANIRVSGVEMKFVRPDPKAKDR
jgi:hypothetical protein